MGSDILKSDVLLQVVLHIRNQILYKQIFLRLPVRSQLTSHMNDNTAQHFLNLSKIHGRHLMPGVICKLSGKRITSGCGNTHHLFQQIIDGAEDLLRLYAQFACIARPSADPLPGCLAIR
ncbi:hypothetical protein D3C75_807270 [compost metagenome]